MATPETRTRPTVNSDMGEGIGLHRFGNDPELLQVVDLANVACGFHAGDPDIMSATVAAAVAHDVAIGAHPSLPDQWGFGRRALVLLGEPTFPGCEIQARIVGMLDMADDKGPDQKLLVVPLTDPHWNHIHGIDQVPPHLLREIEHFFSVYKTLEDKTVETFGWRDAYVGHVVLDEALQRYTANHKPSTDAG